MAKDSKNSNSRIADNKKAAFNYFFEEKFEAGMVFCVESYVGSQASGEGVKLEHQLLITDTGVEIMSDYPFDERLLA